MVVTRKPWSSNGTGPAEVDPVALAAMAHLTKGTLSDYIEGRRRRGVPAVGTVPWP